MPPGARLQIGEVAALTGISPGRIRHYQTQDLIAPGRRDSGYRSFSAHDVLRLLHIDLLRSLGMSLADIRKSLNERPSELRHALEWHRDTLLAQRRRLDDLIREVEEALAAPADLPADIVERLARAQRDTLGPFGRLERPLSPEAAQEYDRLLAEWNIPIAGLATQLVLPEPVTELLERLARIPGHEELFARLRGLAEQVLAVVMAGDEAGADALGIDWVRGQLTQPLPAEVEAVLREAAPRLVDLPLIRSGLALWTESMSPLAGRVFQSIQAEARRQAVVVIGAIVIPSTKPRRSVAMPQSRRAER